MLYFIGDDFGALWGVKVFLWSYDDCEKWKCYTPIGARFYLYTSVFCLDMVLCGRFCGCFGWWMGVFCCLSVVCC